MSTERMQVSNLMVETVRKEIKNMHLGVYPPDGRVRVAAPMGTSDEAIRLFILSKTSWVKKQQLRFKRQDREPQKEYVAGESHYFLGRRYRLNIVKAERYSKIEIKRRAYIDLHVRTGMTRTEKEEVFERFYRAELRKLIPGMIEKWQKRIGVRVQEVKIKKMKRRWGTCNPKASRIWLNLELAKKPLHCIDYVFVHELVHLREKTHSEQFTKIMHSVLPLWQQHKEELNRSALGHFVWECEA